MSVQGAIPVDTSLGSYIQKIALGSAIYALTFTYNPRMGGWILDVADANSNPLVYGIPIVSGWPLLGLLQGVIEGIPPGMLIAIDMTGNGADPTEFTLGANVPLFYVEP